MCVITYKPSHIKIFASDLREMWVTNRNGGGMAWIEDNQLHVVNGLMTLRALQSLVNKHQNHELILHCRTATSGRVVASQTHPMAIDPNSWIMHNGALRGLGDERVSDTCELARILSYLPEEDRIKLLISLPGSYAYLSTTSGIHLIGYYEDYRGLKCSNMYWCLYSFKPARKWGKNDCLLTDEDNGDMI